MPILEKEMRVVARLVGDDADAGSDFRFGADGVIEAAGRKFRFDAVYGSQTSDAAFFEAECRPVIEANGAFVACGACADGVAAAFVDALGDGTASVVDVAAETPRDALSDQTADELAFDPATGALAPALVRVAAADPRIRAAPPAGAHRLLFFRAESGGERCVVVRLASGADVKTQQGLAAFGNVVRDGDEKASNDSKLTRALKGRLETPTVCVFAFAGSTAATVDALRYAARLRRPGKRRDDGSPGDSLRTARLKADHAAEVERLRAEARAFQLAGDRGLARALRDAELSGKARADEFERRDREVALKLKEDDRAATADATRAQLEADRKLAASLRDP